MVYRHRTPYDFFALHDSRYYALELKSNRSLSSFPFTRVEEHQEQGLLEAAQQGGEAFILINFRKPSNVAYAVSIQDWLRLKAELSPRKSIPKTLFEPRPEFIPIPRTKLGDALIWDLRVLPD